MKNIQIIDGAANSTFDIYTVPDEVFSIIFPDGENIAFLNGVKLRMAILDVDNETFWPRVYAHKTIKSEVIGIHGTLHLSGSACKELYFPTRREEEVVGQKKPFLSPR